MINIVAGPSTRIARCLLAAGALAAFGAASSPVEAPKPVAGPVLRTPALPTVANDPATMASPEAPSRPVPLMEGLLARPTPEKPSPQLGPRTVHGKSVRISTPSAVNSVAAKPGGADAPTDSEAKSSATSLNRLVDRAIEITSRRHLTIGKHTPWQIGHGMLAFRRNYMLRKEGHLVNAYEWVATNPVFTSHTPNPVTGAPTRELPWFSLTPYGARPQPYTGRPKEFEGHPNQVLAFFAMARLPVDFEFAIEGKTVTLQQMLHNAKMEVNDREEVTWTLWTFSYYFDVDEHWINAAGEPWSMERLVATTLRQFLPTRSPCGGCHALFALASARNSYLQSAGQPLSGIWMKAHMHIQKHIALAKSMQNDDASFSSNFFKGPGQTSDPSKRISTTGHTLEFLMVALPKNRLDDQWVQDAVRLVAEDLIEYQDYPLGVGGMYHAVHSLVLYRERTRPQFFVKQPAQDLASPTTTTARRPLPGRRVR